MTETREKPGLYRHGFSFSTAPHTTNNLELRFRKRFVYLANCERFYFVYLLQ